MVPARLVHGIAEIRPYGGVRRLALGYDWRASDDGAAGYGRIGKILAEDAENEDEEHPLGLEIDWVCLILEEISIYISYKHGSLLFD